MDDQELSRMEVELRGIMAESGLDWVLSRLNEAIPYGIVEERSVDQYDSRQESKLPVPSLMDEDGTFRHNGRPRLAITSRPQTVQERVLSLLEALERITIELPAIEQDALTSLASVGADEKAAARSVRFSPDEDMRDNETVLKPIDNESELRRTDFERLLSALRQEVRS